VNTYEWYSQRVYHIGPDYNPENRMGAFQQALEWEIKSRWALFTGTIAELSKKGSL